MTKGRTIGQRLLGPGLAASLACVLAVSIAPRSARASEEDDYGRPSSEVDEVVQQGCDLLGPQAALCRHHVTKLVAAVQVHVGCSQDADCDAGFELVGDANTWSPLFHLAARSDLTYGEAAVAWLRCVDRDQMLHSLDDYDTILIEANLRDDGQENSLEALWRGLAIQALSLGAESLSDCLKGYIEMPAEQVHRCFSLCL